MNTKVKELVLYGAWPCLYILCVGLGTVEQVEGLGKVLFILTSLIFFVPGVCLLVLGIGEKNQKMVLRVRIIALCSLALTVIVFCANLIAVTGSGETGSFLHDLLNLVSAPMFCSQYRIIGVFLWACLLVASFNTKNKK